MNNYNNKLDKFLKTTSGIITIKLSIRRQFHNINDSEFINSTEYNLNNGFGFYNIEEIDVGRCDLIIFELIFEDIRITHKIERLNISDFFILGVDFTTEIYSNLLNKLFDKLNIK